MLADGVTQGRSCWAEWLAERRYGGDGEARRRGLEELTQWRDQVLDNAQLAEDKTVLDVGCGEGLIGFGALECGASTVIFSDISQGVLDRCRFVRASAHDLASLNDESVDVVTTRSVLIYVAHKESAIGESSRVLRSGGRMSLTEPINGFASEPPTPGSVTT